MEGTTGQTYPDIASLLAPSTLTALTGSPVSRVNVRPIATEDGLSGGEISYVETEGLSGEGRLILKRISYESDWVMRVTRDRAARAVLCWTTGLLDDLPPELSHEVLACSRDGAGWALLLRDVGQYLFPPGDVLIKERDNERLLDAMAALNAAFFGRTELADPSFGFVDLRWRYGALSPQVIQAELANTPQPTPAMALAGWQLLETSVGTDVAALVRDVHARPARLGKALARYPLTVVHGDWKLGNLGLYPEPGPAILLDWAAVGPAPPPVELAWYLGVNSARLPVPKEDCIEIYQDALARRLGERFEEAWWRPALSLALLGGFVLLGWPKLLGANSTDEAVRQRERAELGWWSDRVREGSMWL